jgi:hypothetical protein
MNDDMLAIIGHPNGVPKVIEAGPQTDLHGNQLGYNDIDTLGGSSGSAVLGPAGTIVGVHTNGGCTTGAIGHNHGVRISSILAASTTVSGVAVNPGKFANDSCNIIKLKFSDDNNWKPILDGGVFKPVWHDTKPVWNDIDPKALFDKRIDDVKTTAYDWNVRDPRWAVDPAIRPVGHVAPGIVGRQPLVLSTPHHSEAMAAAAGTSGDVVQALAAQVNALQTQLAALAENLEQISGPGNSAY